MKRRSFIAALVQTVAAAAVAANLVREDAIAPNVPEAKFDPRNYAGDFRWVNITRDMPDWPNQMSPTFHG